MRLKKRSGPKQHAAFVSGRAARGRVKCPICHAMFVETIDSRFQEAPWRIKRRRGCGSCGNKFTTFETVADDYAPFIDLGAGI